MSNINDSNILHEMLSKPEEERGNFFALNHHRIIDDSIYWVTLGTLWKAGGHVMQQDQWKPLFNSSRRNRNKIMKKRERKEWRRLPKVITAYRAVNNEEEKLNAISWTLSKKIAEEFSFEGAREIYKRAFNKNEVFAYFDRRKEKEILVNIKCEY